MTCRVARSYQHFAQMEPVPCSECGSAYMDVPVASGIRTRVCPICAQSLSQHVASSVHAPCVPMRHQKVA
jgi:uncharacterized paraquat-inducible protein A